MTGARIPKADMTGADLGGATIIQADLSGVLLGGAVLAAANLRDAYLNAAGDAVSMAVAAESIPLCSRATLSTGQSRDDTCRATK